MLTSHSSSEDEKILYLRKFAQIIRNNNEGPQLTSMRFIASPDLANSSLPCSPPGLVSWSPWRNSSTASAEEFYYSFYYNEGLENTLTRAPLLGLTKSIYHFLSFKLSESSCGKNCWNSRLSCSGCLTAINL